MKSQTKQEGVGLKNKSNNEPHEPRLKNGTVAFDLSTLTLCGARTRAGQPCKRFGNLKNGRCRLHGGLSQGPSTEKGLKKSQQANYKHGYYSLETRAEMLELKQLIKESKRLIKLLTGK